MEGPVAVCISGFGVILSYIEMRFMRSMVAWEIFMPIRVFLNYHALIVNIFIMIFPCINNIAICIENILLSYSMFTYFCKGNMVDFHWFS